MAAFGNYILDRFLQQYSCGPSESDSQLNKHSKSLAAPTTLSRRRKTVKYPWSDSSEDEPEKPKVTSRSANSSTQATRRFRRHAKPSCSLVDTYKYSETSKKTLKLDAFLKKYSAETYAKQTMNILNSLAMNEKQASKDLTEIHKEKDTETLISGWGENEEIFRRRTSRRPETETAPKAFTATPKLDEFFNVKRPVLGSSPIENNANESEKSQTTLFRYFKKSKNCMRGDDSDQDLMINKKTKFRRNTSSNSTDTIRRKSYSQRINSCHFRTSSALNRQNSDHRLREEDRILNKSIRANKQPTDLAEKIFLKRRELLEEKFQKQDSRNSMASTTDDSGWRKVDSTISNFNIMLKNVSKSYRKEMASDKSKTTDEKRYESLSDFLNESQKRLTASEQNPTAYDSLDDIGAKTVQQPISFPKFGLRNANSSTNITQETCSNRSTSDLCKFKTTNQFKALTETNKISTQGVTGEKSLIGYAKSEGVVTRASSNNNSGDGSSTKETSNAQSILKSKHPSGSSSGRRLESSEGFSSLSNPTTRKDQKIPVQTLENLYRLHESNTWISQVESSASNRTSSDLQKEAKNTLFLQNVPINSLPDDYQNPKIPDETNIPISIGDKVLTTNLFEKEVFDHQTQYDDDNYLSIICDNQLESNSQEDCVERDDTEDSGILTQSFTQDTIEKENRKPNVTKRSRKQLKVTSKCILYEDNLLKELLGEKSRILTAHNKRKFRRTVSGHSDEVLAKTYIKRYRKGQTKIFKIGRRAKTRTEDDYQPPEDKFLDKFIERLNNNFRDESSSDNESVESISTPTSYITDETKSDVLSTGSRKLTSNQMLVREGVNNLLSDRNLLFSRYSDRAPKEFDRSNIIARVDEIIAGTLENYERGEYPRFAIPTAHISNCVFENDRYQMVQSPKCKIVSYKSPCSRTRFNLILLLLNKIRILLVTGTKLTKREIYYQLRTMMTNQGATDRAINDISRMLNVGVWALNLTAQKGMVYGKLKLVMRNGETINCNVPGTLVPKDVTDICEIQSDAYFILVVEKESIFNKLLEEDLPKRLTRPFILMTGKGFPDLNTQLFLKKLWMIMTVPVLIFVDADPDGIAIMLTYRFGSVANAHVSDHLAIPKSRWLGVFPSEIPTLSLDSEALSHRDVGKTKSLLQLQCVQENDKIKQQLETLLANGIKTGIEGLMRTETYLSHRYLSSKFQNNDLI